MILLNGKEIAQKIKDEVKQKIAAKKITPGLAVILVGADPASHLYVGLKEKTCAEVGIHFEKYLFFATEPEEKIIKKIETLNSDPNIHGVLVQLPLPASLDENKIIAAIDPKKDVDGFHPENIKKLLAGEKTIISPLIQSIVRLIEVRLIGETYPAPDVVRDKKIAILANSKTFIEPLKKIFEGNQIITAISPSDPTPFTKDADIIIIALGQPKILTSEMVRDGVVIIDIGTNRLLDGTTCGDVDAQSMAQKNVWLTPVPGGVGPMTVALLLKNTTDIVNANPSSVLAE